MTEANQPRNMNQASTPLDGGIEHRRGQEAKAQKMTVYMEKQDAIAARIDEAMARVGIDYDRTEEVEVVPDPDVPKHNPNNLPQPTNRRILRSNLSPLGNSSQAETHDRPNAFIEYTITEDYTPPRDTPIVGNPYPKTRRWPLKTHLSTKGSPVRTPATRQQSIRNIGINIYAGNPTDTNRDDMILMGGGPIDLLTPQQRLLVEQYTGNGATTEQASARDALASADFPVEANAYLERIGQAIDRNVEAVAAGAPVPPQTPAPETTNRFAQAAGVQLRH